MAEREVGQAEVVRAGKAPGADSLPPRGPEGPGASEPSDEQLEALWKQGSAPAFAILFERWHRRAYAFAYRRTNGDANLAEEVAQRAFVNLYAKPPPGEGRGSFKSLLFTVVENELRTEARKRGRRKEQAIEAALDGHPDGTERPEEGLEKEDERRRVEAALAELPEEERSLVLLREVEGLTFREVCEATGLTRDMVRGRLGKALARLKSVLGRKR